jgi:hypothetical protein
MADPNKNSFKYKTPKLKDLLKGSGWEEIPSKIFNPETGDSKKGGKIAIDVVLPVDKKIVLKADDTDYERGLIVTWKSDGGYDVQYWYETPDNIVPAELKGDGVSKGKSIKKVYLGYHPELDK